MGGETCRGVDCATNGAFTLGMTTGLDAASGPGTPDDIGAGTATGAGGRGKGGGTLFE